MDQELEEARSAHQLMGPSDGVMARNGLRVLPPRDHRHGWDHPYSRPGGHSGKGGGKNSGHSDKGGGNSGKGNDGTRSSSSSGQGAGGSPYPSRERALATRRIQQLQISKWDRSPTPGDNSREDPEEDNQATVTPLNEGSTHS
jgi:hypothetical protein